MLRSIKLQNFRTYTEREFHFKPGITIITGGNGSGKTTVLEAIHMMISGGSFRGDDGLVINHGADWARIDMGYEGDAYTLKLGRTLRDKTLLRNNQPVRKISPSSLLFEPEQLRILHGPPDLRRRWLDELITALDPAYPALLRGYARAMRQRNALLSRGQFHKDDLFVWDVKLAEYGALIVRARHERITYINQYISDEYQRLSGQLHKVILTYDTPFTEDYGSQLLRALGERLEIDQQRGFTSRGPHREDILISLGNKAVAETASRGERRTIYLATKLIELQQLRATNPNQPPILLLDDVFAEFDQTHQELIASLDLDTQILITSVDPPKHSFKKRSHHIHID
jgi:DNA replication and repair protein RecF